ncbi:hypothetical protein [Actinomyces trachealis]|uniref:hypothetical protein n=1 Tax=Actinomyces trachealis TaxID=2763540 RepID=UPI0018C6D4F3|nr:hypothetical protein [Actinomyces trachealis]
MTTNGPTELIPASTLEHDPDHHETSRLRSRKGLIAAAAVVAASTAGGLAWREHAHSQALSRCVAARTQAAKATAALAKSVNAASALADEATKAKDVVSAGALKGLTSATTSADKTATRTLPTCQEDASTSDLKAAASGFQTLLKAAGAASKTLEGHDHPGRAGPDQGGRSRPGQGPGGGQDQDRGRHQRGRRG